MLVRHLTKSHDFIITKIKNNNTSRISFSVVCVCEFISTTNVYLFTAHYCSILESPQCNVVVVVVSRRKEIRPTAAKYKISDLYSYIGQGRIRNEVKIICLRNSTIIIHILLLYYYFTKPSHVASS